MTSATKNPYEVLGLEPGCPTDEIKKRFRQQIALYHPDKVQHLGKEIQDLAAARAADLTEAYEFLGDSARRTAYDAQLEISCAGGECRDESLRTGGRESAIFREEARSTPTRGPGEIEVSDFMRKAAINRLRSTVAAHVPGAGPKNLTGFDAAFVSRSKWSLFKPQPSLCVLGRLVDRVDGEAVRDTWRYVLRPGLLPPGETYLFLMGSPMEEGRTLSRAITETRGRAPVGNGIQILMVPLNISTWEALTPCQAPALLRTMIGALRTSTH
jgi:curved DNA-binding protein CbpA